MTIKANILAVKDAILAEMAASPGHTSATADRIKRKGLDAILGGAPAWIAYMQEFAKPAKPEELARLVPTDGTGNQADMNDARAYLVANGPCGVETVTKLEVGITDILDQ